MAKAAQPQQTTALSISRDYHLLHPILRESVVEVLAQCKDAGMPFELFEGYRSPERQRYLYEQGRTRKGRIITKAQPWQSMHQYGLAVDLVLKIGDAWSWRSDGIFADHWNTLALICEKYGLEGISWELPHFQLSGVLLSDAQAGRFPGGDNVWWSNLQDSAAGWKGTPVAPLIGQG